MPTTDTPDRRTIAVGDGETHDEAVAIDAEGLFGLLTPQTVELLRTIAREQPASIREAARLVDRDIKNVHRELIRLGARGLVTFEDEGRARRPVVSYDALRIDIGLSIDTGTGTAPDSEPS